MASNTERSSSVSSDDRRLGVVSRVTGSSRVGGGEEPRDCASGRHGDGGGDGGGDAGGEEYALSLPSGVALHLRGPGVSEADALIGSSG